MISKEQKDTRFPQSSFFEFYCNEHRMSLEEYLKNSANEKVHTLNKLAEYYDEITYDIVNQVFVVEKNGKLNFIYETELEFTPPLFNFSPVLYDFCHIYPGFAVVRKGARVGNLFFHEGLSEPSSYRTVNIFEVKQGKNYGVETATGGTLLACDYRFVKIYPDFILAISNEGFLLFHLDGRRMLEECFDEIDLTMMHKYDEFSMSKDYLFVQKNELIVLEDGKYGIIDREETIISNLALSKSCSEIFNQFMGSSCFDFFKKPWICKEIGDTITGLKDNFDFNDDLYSDEKNECEHEFVDYKEAIRWYMMYSVLNDDLCDWYFKRLSRKYKSLFSKKSNELLSLFKLKNIRTMRYGRKEYKFEYQIFNLANIFFEGKKNKINYQNAFELYSYCIEDIYCKKECDFRVEYNELISMLRNVSYFVYDYVLIAHRIAWMLYTGNGVEKDETTGMILLKAVREVVSIMKIFDIEKHNAASLDKACPF